MAGTVASDAGVDHLSASAQTKAATGRWFGSIRFKLILIVSVTLIVSLGAMTFFAGSYFRSRSETLIQEYNLSLARLIGQKVEADLQALVYSASVLESVTGGSAAETKYQAKFFAAHPGVLLFGTSRRNSRALDAVHFNHKSLTEHSLATTQLRASLEERLPHLAEAAGGSIILENISPLLKFPSMALCFRSPDRPDTLIFLVLESVRVLRAFETTGQAQIFELRLVSPRGTVLAASDPAEALAAANRSEIPIINSLIQGKLDNGSQKYAYGDFEYLGSFQNIKLGGLGVVSTVRADRAFEAVVQTRRRNVQISIIVLTAALLVVFFFSRTLTIPIVRLVQATRRIEAGKFDVHIEPTSRDEVGTLTRSFLSMARGLQERERIKTTFGKFVNPKIVERALASDLELGGEDRVCTILFTDLRNFTGLSENQEPSEVVGLLNSYFTAMVDCVHQLGGVVDKFIGDAIMAHWGALENTENDVANAVEAALRMRAALTEFNKQHTRDGRPPVRFGCGINTGHVIAGQIGSTSRLEYTVIGDAVNLASRIEYLNKLFGTDILISRYAYEEVRHLFRFARTQPIEIKGKANPEVVYAVLGRRDDPNAPASVKELRQQIGLQWDAEAAKERLAVSSDRFLGETGEAVQTGEYLK